MRKFELVFDTALSASDTQHGKRTTHAVEIEVPNVVVDECARRFITILLQSQLRQGIGEFGVLEVGKDKLKYRHQYVKKTK